MKLAFYRGLPRNPRSLVGDWLVCLFTWSRYSHVEWVQSYAPAGASLCWSASQRDGCVRQALIDLQSGRWDVVDVPGDDAAAMAWFAAHAGQRYDWPGLLNFVPVLSLFDWASADKWICSAAVAAAMGMADAHQVSPQDLYLALPAPT